MKALIATTDYSDLANNAVEYAAQVAFLNEAKLILYNDFTVPVHALNGRISGPELDELLKKNNERLRHSAEALKYRFKIEVSPVTTFSFIEDELSSLADKFQADLIVMGMHKKSFEQDLMGSKTTSVIKNLSIPVLAVPIDAKFEGTKKVLFACDILNGVSKLLLMRIKNLATKLGAEVEILLIDQTIDHLRSNVGEKLTMDIMNQDLSGTTYYYKNVQSDSVVEAIKNEVTQYHADLLIMVPQKHGFWDSLIHQSKTRTMAAGLNIPLLSIPV